LVRIIFVCTGNICRSPLAAGILKARFLKDAVTDAVVTSMGVHGLERQPPSNFAMLVGREHGIDISEHRSRPLIPHEIETADLIFTMDRMQKDFIKLFFPQVDDQPFLLASWPNEERRKDMVKDPMGKSMKVYRQVYEEIARHIDRIYPVIRESYC